MAEALSLASSIVALVQLSASIYSATSKFYREAKEAKSRIGALATQTRNLSGVLQNLSLLASSPLFDDAGVSALDFRDTYIESCYNTLYKIKRKLDKAEGDFDSGSQKRIITRSLKWPFASQETKDLVTELSHHQDVLHLALSAETMSQLLQCLANTNSIAKSVDILNQKLDRKRSIDMRAELTAKREEIVRFFLKVNPENKLQDCRSQRQPNTGKWLIERDRTFRNWMGLAGSQIWLSGIPGAGKTILCGTVIEEILQTQSPSTAVAFFFCDYKYSESQKPINILATLAVQLAKQANVAFETLESYYEELHPHNRIAKPPETKRMIEVVQSMINHYDRVYLAVDGLDECGQNVSEAIQTLKQLTQGSEANMALFSRKEHDIIEELSDSPHIEIAAHTEDLELYVLAQMASRKRLGNLAVKNPELHEHIRRTLIGGANGMFRWVACQLDHLDGLPSDGRRRKALNELPPSLFETYDRILDRIMQEDEKDQHICRKALYWIGLGYLRIGPMALCEAISIPDDQDLVDKDLWVEPDWVSRMCSSLVRLAEHGSNNAHFQLAHFTVKEYLRSIKPQSERSLFRFSEDEAIQSLFRTSLRFLISPVFDRKPIIAKSEIQRIAERNENHPFYPVAADYMFCSGPGWEQSLRLNEQLSLLLEDETMLEQAIKLFNPDNNGTFLSWVLQFAWAWMVPRQRVKNENEFFSLLGIILAPEFSALQVAAMLALPSVCAYLIDVGGVNPNLCGRLGAPLHALLAGFGLLLWFRSDFQYDPRVHYRIALESTVQTNDQLRKCLEILLDHGADTSLRWNQTSVMEMAINNAITGYSTKFWIDPLITQSTIVPEDFIETFKENLVGGLIEQPLLDAILLIGSDPNAAPGWARLASLIQTRRMGSICHAEGIDVAIDLLKKVSDEDFADGVQNSIKQDLTDSLRAFVQDPRFQPQLYMPYGDSEQMPILKYAIAEGSVKSVELLLDAGCDPQVVDENDGWTAVHQCAACDTGGAEMMALLLKSGAADSAKNHEGDTCWHVAAENGNTSSLNVLVEMGSDTKESLATTSSAGRTPLASAIHEGHLETAMMLLDHCGPDLHFFQSDQPLLNRAAAIGSKDLFLRLYDKLKEANATESIDSSKPLQHINMSCSVELVDYLLDSWAMSDGEASTALTIFLLHANDIVFQDQEKYPSRTDMDHIIRGLLPPKDAVNHDGPTRQQFWNIFCENVVPNLTKVCEHNDAQCRTGLISMMFEILIDVGVLHSYERKAPLTSYKVLFQSLLDRGNNLKCSWIASSVQKVIEADSLSLELTNEAVSIELLSNAMQQSNIDLVRQLLDHGVDIHTAHGGLSPVEQACYASDLTMFHLIIDHVDKTLVNRAGYQGKTLLHWAVSGTVPGYLAKIQQLLKLGANIDSEVHDPNADTALTLASRSYRQDIVALLVSKGANSLYRGRDGWSVLHAAAVSGDFQYIHSLLSSEAPRSFWLGTCTFPFLLVDGRPHRTQNTAAIHLAAHYGKSNFVKFMIQTDLPFDVNGVTGYPSLTPLHLASLAGHHEIAEILISSNANVNARDANHNLATDLAAMNGHLGVVKLLLMAGSEKPSNLFSDAIARLMTNGTGYMEDAEDTKAISHFDFEMAIIRGSLEHCQKLMAQGHSINAELLTHSYTPLVCAVVHGQADIVDWLVSAGVEVTNPVIKSLHPSLRCMASLTTHHIPSTKTLAAVMSLALKQNVSWYGGILGPLHVAILNDDIGVLEVALKHIRENDHAYRKMIDNEMICLPADIIGWRGRSSLSILVNEVNQDQAFSNGPPWTQGMPSGSPLHWAIRKSDVSAVKLLLENEAESPVGIPQN
ncbi:hypothetical protein INS49_004811 [Diaporthe citri]|uniref:uncharacterized protein n=1 Tax=Diaporthe citri TaxID=83186 RepID=UPI001C7F9C19|nr:uncharacterized protein INS49_004811 [Diaporthe citri]KAG6354207.1 hypothetical protein INS49_004811 [Diaporthe citri]